jgi:hypothetical protein
MPTLKSLLREGTAQGMKKSVILLYVGAACCMLPGASAWNGGIPRSFVRGDASPKAASMARSGSPTMPVMSLGDDGFGRRDALSAMLASATLLSLGGPAAAKDVGDGGLPAGLKEYFDMLQTKKQVKTLAQPGKIPPLLPSSFPSANTFLSLGPLLPGQFLPLPCWQMASPAMRRLGHAYACAGRSPHASPKLEAVPVGCYVSGLRGSMRGMICTFGRGFVALTGMPCSGLTLGRGLRRATERWMTRSGPTSRYPQLCLSSLCPSSSLSLSLSLSPPTPPPAYFPSARSSPPPSLARR